jgi:hypothetical protein
MRYILLLAGAAVLATSAPAFAKPGHGHGNGGGHGQQGGYDRDDRDDRDSRDGGYDRRGDDRRDYARRDCPPGLAKKHNGCMPPGQARKLARGQRYQSGYGTQYGYNQIPYDVRRQYDLDSANRYYYDNGTLYGVDRRTGIIEQVLRTILR